MARRAAASALRVGHLFDFRRPTTPFRFGRWFFIISRCGAITIGERSCGGGILQPGRGPSTTPSSSPREPFQCQYRFFDLLPLEPELGEHFIYVQVVHPYKIYRKFNG